MEVYITSSVTVIAQRSAMDTAMGSSCGVAALLWRLKRPQEPIIVTAGARIGVIIYPVSAAHKFATL